MTFFTRAVLITVTFSLAVAGGKTSAQTKQVKRTADTIHVSTLSRARVIGVLGWPLGEIVTIEGIASDGLQSVEHHERNKGRLTENIDLHDWISSHLQRRVDLIQSDLAGGMSPHAIRNRIETASRREKSEVLRLVEVIVQITALRVVRRI